MNDLERNLTTVIAEQCLIGGSRAWKANAEVIRLAAALRSDQDGLFGETMNALKEQGILSSWRRDADEVVVEVSDEFRLPDISETQREKIGDSRLRRVLLFRLYDEHRRAGHKFARYPLASMAGALRTTKEDIFRHVTHMESDCLLVYGIGDGGQSTCHIGDVGIELCENRDELFARFGTINAVDKDTIKPVEANVDAYVSETRIAELERVSHPKYDLKRVVALCKEADMERLTVKSYLCVKSSFVSPSSKSSQAADRGDAFDDESL